MEYEFPPYRKGSRMPKKNLDANEVRRTADWFLDVFESPASALANLRVLRDGFVGQPTFDEELARVEKELRARVLRDKSSVEERRKRSIL